MSGKDHLYVMQSADGFIKIGRSKDPEARRTALQNERWCSVILVAVFIDRGDEERAVLNALQAHRRKGEWFHDKTASREALVALLGELKFKHQGWDKDPRTDPNGAVARWLTKQEERRASRDAPRTKFISFVKPRWDLASFAQGSPVG